MSARQYAEPSPWAVNDADLARLREQLEKAKHAAATAETWTWRARAEQDVEELTRRIEGTTVDVERRRRERIAAHAGSLAATERAVQVGKYLAPVSPWATNAPTEAPTSAKPASAPDDYDAGRAYLIDSLKRAGKPIPAWLAA